MAKYCKTFHAEFAGIELTGLNCIVITVYRSSSYGVFTVFIEQLEQMLSDIFNRYRNIIIAGDFNCDATKQPKNAHTLHCVMSTFDLANSVHGFTRIAQGSASCLDAIYTNIGSWKFVTDIIDPGMSDHAGQYIQFEKEQPMCGCGSEVIKRVQPACLNSFREAIASVDWNSFGFSNLGAERAMGTFIHLLQSFMDRCRVVGQFKKRKKSPVGWFTDELRNLRDVLQALKVVCSVSDEISDWNAYRSFRKFYREQIAISKKKAYEEFINEADNKQKACWKLVNRERTVKKIQICNKTDISADVFNTFFPQPPKIL